jgi:hypothetical protein
MVPTCRAQGACQRRQQRAPSPPLPPPLRPHARQPQQLTVVVPGVCDVLLEAVDGPQAAHCCLAAEAQECEHGQAAVLELLQLGLLAAHAHGVKGEAAQHAGLVCVCVCVCVCVRVGGWLVSKVGAPCLESALSR